MNLPIFFDEEDEWQKAFLLYDAVLKEIGTKIEILNNEFKIAHQYNPIEHILSRIKSQSSIARKLRLKNLEFTVSNALRYINDIAGVRIICSFTSDIYRIANAIVKQNDVTVLKIKDYIANPKKNGYTSYHMIVSIPIYLSNDKIDVKAEIQIRTIAMDFWASLEHKIYYKFDGKAPEGIYDQLKECADIITYLDKKMLSINESVQEYHDDFNGGTVVDNFYQSDENSSNTIIDNDIVIDDISETDSSQDFIDDNLSIETSTDEQSEETSSNEQTDHASFDEQSEETSSDKQNGKVVSKNKKQQNTITIPDELRKLFGSIISK